MAKILLKRKAVSLRKQGKSYSDIRKIVKVSKSSLSLWLKDIQLTENQIDNLQNRRKRAVEKYRTTMKLKRKNRLDGYLVNQKKTLLPLTDREIFIAGLFLYSGEGNKVDPNVLSVANSDPTVIKFCFYWMKKSLNIPDEKIFVKLHLYSDMDIQTELNYWSKVVGIKLAQFKKPYIKKTTRSSVDQKGFGHGTCNLVVFNTVIKENVMMAIKAISDSCGKI